MSVPIKNVEISASASGRLFLNDPQKTQGTLTRYTVNKEQDQLLDNFIPSQEQQLQQESKELIDSINSYIKNSNDFFCKLKTVKTNNKKVQKDNIQQISSEKSERNIKSSRLGQHSTYSFDVSNVSNTPSLTLPKVTDISEHTESIYPTSMLIDIEFYLYCNDPENYNCKKIRQNSSEAIDYIVTILDNAYFYADISSDFLHESMSKINITELLYQAFNKKIISAALLKNIHQKVLKTCKLLVP
jgi:hypothetical protein